MQKDSGNLDRILAVVVLILIILFSVFEFPKGTGFWNGALFTLLVIGLLVWWYSGFKKIQVGWMAQMLVLGTRVHYVVSEGWRWASFPVGLQEVDTRLSVIKLDPAEAFTQDNIEVVMDASLTRRIVDIDTYLSADPKDLKQWLDDVRDQAFRGEAILKPLTEVLKMHGQVRDRIQKDLGNGNHFGIEIPEVAIASIRPKDPNVLQDLALKEREELQRGGQNVEAAYHLELVNRAQLPQTQGGAGMTRVEAIEFAQMTLGKLTKTAEAKTFSIDAATTAAILDFMARKNA